MFMSEYELKANYEMKKEMFEQEAKMERLLMQHSSKKFDLTKMFKWFKKEEKQNQVCCA